MSTVKDKLRGAVVAEVLDQKTRARLLPSERVARDLHTVLAKRSEQSLLEVGSDLTRDGTSPSERDTRAAVKRYMGGATSHPPGWHELLGTVGDTLRLDRGRRAGGRGGQTPAPRAAVDGGARSSPQPPPKRSPPSTGATVLGGAV